MFYFRTIFLFFVTTFLPAALHICSHSSTYVVQYRFCSKFEKTCGGGGVHIVQTLLCSKCKYRHTQVLRNTENEQQLLEDISNNVREKPRLVQLEDWSSTVQCVSTDMLLQD
jgi:hypothetical protein